MRRWLLRIHLYGGLLCAPYLIIFGITSLSFNHHRDSPEVMPNPIEWQQGIDVASVGENEVVANRVRDALGLGGWTIPWKMSRDAAGNLTFDLERPGKSYTIHALFQEHQARIEERRKGWSDPFRALHAMGSVPNLAYTSLWSIYTEICVWFTVFAALSGIYLWINSQRERRLGLGLLFGASAASFGFIAFIIFHG